MNLIESSLTWIKSAKFWYVRLKPDLLI